MKSLDTVLHYIAPSFLVVLAQSIPLPEGSGSYAEIVRSLGVLVVLAWYMWYTTSVSTPRILESAAKEREISAQAHREEREIMTTADRAEHDQKRKDFLDAMAAQRHEFQLSLTAQTEAFKGSIEKIACKFERQTHVQKDD